MNTRIAHSVIWLLNDSKEKNLLVKCVFTSAGLSNKNKESLMHVDDDPEWLQEKKCQGITVGDFDINFLEIF